MGFMRGLKEKNRDKGEGGNERVGSYKGIMQIKGKDKINCCKPFATQTSIA